MHHLVLVGWLFAAGSSPTPAPALSLCVEVAIAPEVTPVWLDLPELIATLNARIGRRGVVIRGCTGTESADQGWRLLIDADEAAVRLALTGPGRATAQEVAVRGLGPQEAMQLVALTATETIRPSIEPLLEALGSPSRSAPPPVLPPEGLVAPDLLPPASVPTWRYGVGVQAGATTGLDHSGVRVDTQLEPYLGLGAWRTGMLLGFTRTMTGVEEASLRSGLGVAHEWSGFVLGAYGVARLTQLRVKTAPLPSAVERRYWDGGASVQAKLLLWRGSALALGLSAHSTLWWRPRRVRVADELVSAQAMVEAGAAFLLQWSPSPPP